jgi:hypothetical protein
VPLIYKEEGRKVSKLKREKGLVIKRHLTFLSKEEHKVVVSVLFYKVKEKKHYIIRKAILDKFKFTPLSLQS